MDLKNKENISRVSPLCTKGLNYHHKWLRNRELGIKPVLGSNDKVLQEMYSSIRPISQWESFMSSKAAVPGGIFNLEFSPDGYEIDLYSFYHFFAIRSTLISV